MEVMNTIVESVLNTDSEPYSSNDIFQNTVQEHLDLQKLLLAAVKYDASKLCRYLVDCFGAAGAADIVLCGIQNCSFEVREKRSTETLADLCEVCGARMFVEDADSRVVIMQSDYTPVLARMVAECYSVYGDDKAWWQQEMQNCTAQTIWSSLMHHCLCWAVQEWGPSSFQILLRWGMYRALRNQSLSQSTLYRLAQHGTKRDSQLFVSLFPQSLQEGWLVSGVKPWEAVIIILTPTMIRYMDPRSEWGRWVKGPDGSKVKVATYYDVISETRMYFASLLEQRRHVPRLQVLCRSVIFHELGINPIPKIEQLPLPPLLKDFVACKELFDVEYTVSSDN
jgi:hypothetical protein